ncbi:substrate-binding periplasmic protein [Brevibacterium samyangense]|uniref:ABC transporter substrate-binding protein n=1 Tax=Brevibacterium samyangense TaxID=366888 RepID=A0ABP5ESU6_9MICO
MTAIRIRTTALSAAAVLGGALLAGCSSAGASEVAEDCVPAHPEVVTLSEGVLKGSTAITPPYTRADDENRGGTEGRIAKEIAALECLDFQVETSAPGAGFANIETNRADLMMGGVYWTQERADTYTLTDPMYQDGMAIMSKDGFGTIEELEGKKIGTIQGYLWNDDLITALGNGNVTQYQDYTSMVGDLSAGRIKAGVATSAEAAYQVTTDGADGLQSVNFEPTEKVASSMGLSEVVFVITKDNESLLTAMNENIQTLIDNGTMAEILESEGMDPALAGPAE